MNKSMLFYVSQFMNHLLPTISVLILSGLLLGDRSINLGVLGAILTLFLLVVFIRIALFPIKRTAALFFRHEGRKATQKEGLILSFFFSVIIVCVFFGIHASIEYLFSGNSSAGVSHSDQNVTPHDGLNILFVFAIFQYLVWLAFRMSVHSETTKSTLQPA